MWSPHSAAQQLELIKQQGPFTAWTWGKMSGPV